MHVGSLGAVASALLKGVQTVLVFAFSAVFFCQYETAQVLIVLLTDRPG